jgi:hypothetical protein
MSMLNDVLAALSGRFQIMIMGVSLQIEHFHAVRIRRKLFITEAPEDYAEETINVNVLVMHHVCTKDDFKQF